MNEEPAARTRARLEKTKGRHRAKIEILNEILNLDYESRVIMELVMTGNIDSTTTESVIDQVNYEGNIDSYKISGDVSI